MSKQGVKPQYRKLATTSKTGKLQANQWQNTPKQNEFMKYWLDPSSPSFGNGYQSAKRAGYSKNYSQQVASIAPQWLTSFNKVSKMELEHIEQKLIQMINGPLDSRSVDDTRVKAIEVYARVVGKLDNKNTTNVTLVQPILAGSSTTKQESKHRTPIDPTHVQEGELVPDTDQS